MKKHLLLASCLTLALFTPAIADDDDRNFTPFAYHGSVTRITPEGHIRDRDQERNHPLWLFTPFINIYEKAQAPSTSPTSTSSGLGKSLARLCPFWGKPEASTEE